MSEETVRSLATAFIEILPETHLFKHQLGEEAETAGTTAGRNTGNRFTDALRYAVRHAGAELALGASIVGLKALDWIKEANRDASDLNETVSKAQNIFPHTSAALNKFASTSASALGLSKQQALEGAASFGNFFNQIGIGEKQSLNMSTALIKLSADLGSFNNADPSEVMDSFLSATRGEYDSLQKFIPTVNAATVETEALRLSHKNSAKDLTDADKATALYAIAMRDAGKAQGDFARTAAGQANASRTWKANLSDIRAEIGTALLPVSVTFINALNTQLVPLMKNLWTVHGPQVVKFLLKIASGMEAFVAALNTGKSEGTGFEGFMSRLGVAVKGLGPRLGELVDHVKAWFAAQKGAGNFNSLGDSVGKLLPLVKDFKNELPSLSNLLSVSAVVIGFLADHTDLLRAMMPGLIAGIIAYKTAQASANIASAVSRVYKIAETVATQLQTAAENEGALARIRSTATMVAQRAASIAVRVATLAWVGVQWLLNAALSANPIGIVIIAIVALVAAVIYAYKHSETFRKIVQAAWRGVQIAVKAVVDWFVNTAWPFLQKVWNGIVAGVRIAVALVKAYFELARNVARAIFGFIASYISGRIAAIRAVVATVIQVYHAFRNAFGRAYSAVVSTMGSLIGFVRGIPGSILRAVGNLGRLLWNAGRSIINGLLDGIRNKISELRNLLNSVTSWLPSWKGPIEKDRAILAPSGEALMTGFIGGIRRRVPDVRRELSNLTDDLQRWVNPSAGSSGDARNVGGINVEHLEVRAFTDRFRLRDVEEELFMAGVH